MAAIEKIHAYDKVGPDERIIGHTPAGDAIYERTLDKGKSVPLTDEDGNQVWTKHPTTAERILAKRRVVSDPRVERYTRPELALLSRVLGA